MGHLDVLMNIPLIITPGLNTDDTVFSKKGAWADVDKVRFFRGLPQTIGGWESLSGDQLEGVCRTVFPWTDNMAVLNVAFGTNDHLYVYYSGGLYDITPEDFEPGQIDGTGGQGWGTGTYSTGAYSEPSTVDYFPMTWSFSAYGQSLIANPRGQTIFQWTNVTTDPAEPLDNAPEAVSYTLTTNTRQVMAFGCSEEVSGDFNALAIRFSDVEDPTTWDTAPDNLAGEVILEGGGRIVAARQIGSYIMVWTDHALYFGQFTGSTVQPWKFDRLGEHCGLCGPNAAVVVGQRAFWVSPSLQFFTCTMGGEPQAIITPMQVDFAENVAISQYDKIVATSISEFSEVWWFYPDQRDGIENNRYVSLSVTDGVSARGSLPRTAFVDAGPSIAPIGVTDGGKIYYHERGISADGDPFSWYAETADQYIGESDSLMEIRCIWPDFKSQQGAVSMTIGTRLYPQADRREKGPFVLPVGKTRKDFRVQGRIMQFRFSGNASPTFWRMGKPELDVVETGRR